MKKTFLSALMLLIFLLGGCATQAPQSAESGNGTATQTAVSSSLQEETAQQTDAPSKEETERETNSELPEETPQRNEKADAILQQMTVEEKVGQLFIIRTPNGAQTADSEPLNSLLKEYPVGGILFFAPNIQTPAQITAFTSALQEGRKIPLFLSIDEEGGTVTRIAKNSAFDVKIYKSAAAVAKNGDPQEAADMGYTIGSYLKQYGFNLNFAPVADVNTNPKNPVIGVRAFSSDPVVADQMAKAMAKGLQQAGVAPVFKHFPGHGDTKEDSHDGLATVNKTLDELQNCELIPFRNLPENSCVMVGHIALPKVAEPHIPATLSKTVVTDLLRGQMGFEGVIVTDSLAMGAIQNTYSAGDAAVLAVQAGCDILLDPANIPSAYYNLLSAVQEGKISEERIAESVYRILCLKDSLGLLGEN